MPTPGTGAAGTGRRPPERQLELQAIAGTLSKATLSVCWIPGKNVEFMFGVEGSPALKEVKDSSGDKLRARIEPNGFAILEGVDLTKYLPAAHSFKTITAIDAAGSGKRSKPQPLPAAAAASSSGGSERFKVLAPPLYVSSENRFMIPVVTKSETKAFEQRSIEFRLDAPAVFAARSAETIIESFAENTCVASSTNGEISLLVRFKGIRTCEALLRIVDKSLGGLEVPINLVYSWE